MEQDKLNERVRQKLALELGNSVIRLIEAATVNEALHAEIETLKKQVEEATE